MRFVSTFVCTALLANAATYLEPNRGQMQVNTPFVARTPAGSIAAGPSEVTFLRRDGSHSTIVFEGASLHVQAVPGEMLAGVSHYVRDRDPNRWVWDVPHYGSIRYPEVYRGIDLLYRVSHDDLEFDFLLVEGADPARIRWRVSAGARIDFFGNLVLGSARLHPPLAWQTRNGKRVPVIVRFILNRQHYVSFRLGAYDSHLPLTIDPVVQFATFLGGTSNDIGKRVISGSDGAIYLTGDTTSPDFPASISPDDPLVRPEVLLQQTSYLTRLKSDASTIDWSLFIGGSSSQSSFDLRQDTFGNIYLLGGTTSPNFPITPGAWHTTIDPSMADLFLVKFDAQTGHIKTSTFLGTAHGTSARLAIDVAGGIYVGGSGGSSPTAGALQTATPSAFFALRLNSAMNAVVYATYWNLGVISVMDVDVNGGLWVGGFTISDTAFPAVSPLPGMNQTNPGPHQAYLARLNPTGTALTLATLLYGEGRNSEVSDLKIARDGSIHVVGTTSGSKFPEVNPLVLDPLPPNYPPQQDEFATSPFLARVAGDGKSLLQSTLLYGPSYTTPLGQTPNTNFHLLLQPDGSLCLVGLTIQVNAQTVGGLMGTKPSNLPYRPLTGLSCLDLASTRIVLKTALPPTGGAGYNDASGTPDGAILLTGNAQSTFTTTPGVVQPNYAGSTTYSDYYSANAIPTGDAFLLRVGLSNPVPEIEHVYPDFPLLDTSNPGTCSFALSGSGFAYGASLTLGGQPVNYAFSDAANATASFDCAALQPGDNHITLTLPLPGGGSSDYVLSGLNAPPSSISVLPSSVPVGSGETKIVIQARNLSSGSVLYWNGAPRTASFVPDGAASRTGHFELLLEPGELAQPSIVQVTVTNPGPGGGTSPVTLFAVQPASGSGVPVLYPPAPLVFGGISPLGSQVLFTGTGFTSDTRAFWDGSEVPVSSVTTTSITIQPPSVDLSQLGAHDLYVLGGTLQSQTVRVFVGRALSAGLTAYDSVLKRLYALSRSGIDNPSWDLLVLDGTTGNLLSTVPGIVSTMQAVALSANGQYLYIAGAAAGIISRYNTVSGSIDLQWNVPLLAGQTTGGPTAATISTILTPPDSPETLIVSTTAGEVRIFDRDRQRLYDSLSAGFIANPLFGGAFFASASRIYESFGGPLNCWIWLDYDFFGISGGQPSCGGEPPETGHASGVIYLFDGTRALALSWPSAAQSTPLATSPLTIDLTQRHVWQFGWVNASTGQLLDYALDAEQLQVRAQINTGFALHTSTLYPVDGGAILAVFPDYVLLIPTTVDSLSTSNFRSTRRPVALADK